MEFMEGGSLYDGLHSEYAMSWDLRLRYICNHPITRHSSRMIMERRELGGGGGEVERQWYSHMQSTD